MFGVNPVKLPLELVSQAVSVVFLYLNPCSVIVSVPAVTVLYNVAVVWVIAIADLVTTVGAVIVHFVVNGTSMPVDKPQSLFALI